MPPSSTSEAPGTPGQPGRDQAGGAALGRRQRATLRRAARRARSPPAWPGPRRRPRGRTARGARPPGGRRRRSAASGWRITTSISARERADGRLGAAGVAAEVLERVGDRRLGHAVDAQHPARQRRRPAAAPPAGSRRPSATSRDSSTGGPGSTTIRWSPTGMITPGAVPTGGSTSAPAGHGGLLAVAAREAGGVDAAGARELGHDRVDLRQRRLVEHQLDARHRRHAGDRAVVVRRAEAARREHQVDAALQAARTAPRRSRPRGRRPRRSAPAARRSRRARARGTRSCVSTVRPIRISEPVTRTAARTWVTRSALTCSVSGSSQKTFMLSGENRCRSPTTNDTPPALPSSNV